MNLNLENKPEPIKHLGWVNGYIYMFIYFYDLKVLSKYLMMNISNHYEEMINEGIKLKNINRKVGRKIK